MPRFGLYELVPMGCRLTLRYRRCAGPVVTAPRGEASMNIGEMCKREVYIVNPSELIPSARVYCPVRARAGA